RVPRLRRARGEADDVGGEGEDEAADRDRDQHGGDRMAGDACRRAHGTLRLVVLYPLSLRVHWMGRGPAFVPLGTAPRGRPASRKIKPTGRICMSRIVKRSRSEPYEVTVGGETQYICACGLSRNLPYCDGSHEMTKDEPAGKLYWY